MSIMGLVGAFVDSIGLNRPLKESDPEDFIQVCVRIRPILKDEREDSLAWNWEENTITPHNPIHLPYTFDHLFFPKNSNNDIFDSVVRNVVLRSMQGVHGSVFTYGQTSSGKTFTINGSQEQPGIITQSIFYCFESIQNRFTDREFLFRVSYIEVYNEQIKDLLSTEPTQIKIQYDPKLGTQLSGVKEQVVLSPHQVIALLKAGEAHRHVGATDMNEKSSRAHTLFKLIIESKLKGDAADAPVRVSNLNLVDLAGSENAKMTNSVGERAREAKHINQSLLTLSLIIQRLSEEKPGFTKKQYLPYRDSKLTRLLQASLSGNAQIAVICTVSPTQRCVDETHNTLKFAARAKKIKTNATVNEIMDDKTLLRAYKMEIHALKARLVAMEGQPKLDIDSQAMFVDGSEGDDLQRNDVNERREEGEDIVYEMIRHLERLILAAPNNMTSKPPTTPRAQIQESSRPFLSSSTNKKSLSPPCSMGLHESSSSSSSSSKRNNHGSINLNGNNSHSAASPFGSLIDVDSMMDEIVVSTATKGPARKSGLQLPSHFSTPSTASNIDLIPDTKTKLDIIMNQEGAYDPDIRDKVANVKGERLNSREDSDGELSRESSSIGRDPALGSFDDDLVRNTSSNQLDSTRRNIQTPNVSFTAVLSVEERERLETGLGTGTGAVAALKGEYNLKIPEKSKSSSSIGKAYLKSIESPSSSPNNFPSPKLRVPSQTGIWRDRNTAVGRLSTSASRKFGFVPSAALTKSLSKVEKDSKDSEISNGTPSCKNDHNVFPNINYDDVSISNRGKQGYFPLTPVQLEPNLSDDKIVADREDGDKNGEWGKTNRMISLEDSRMIAVANLFEHVNISSPDPTKGGSGCVKSNDISDEHDGPKDAKNLENGDQMLFGVSQMLAMLKKHVEKSSALKRRLTPFRKGTSSSSLPEIYSTPPSTVDDSRRISYSSSMGGIGIRDMDPTSEYSPFISINLSSSSPLPLPLHPPNLNLNPSESTLVQSLLVSTPGGKVTEQERFLLEEIEKKDNVLAMLTQGLREVENFQAGYMHSLNIDLALAKAHNEDLLGQVEHLSSATTELKNALDEREIALSIRERQLVFISGVLPSYDEF